MLHIFVVKNITTPNDNNSVITLSGIPEFRRVPREEGPPQPPLRRAAGLLGLAAGVLMGIGYVALSVAEFSIIGLFIAAAGSATPSTVMSGALVAVAGVIALGIGIYSFIAGVRGRSSHPGPAAASLAGFWAALLLVMNALAITNLAISGAGVRAYTVPILGVVGSVLVLIAYTLVRPGSSFGAWVAGSSLGLAGLIIMIVRNHLAGEAVVHGEYVPAGTLTTIATLTYTPVLIGGVIAAAALLMAPFLGARRVWVSEAVAALGAIIGAGSLAYIAATSIEPLYRVYELASIMPGDLADILKLVGIAGTAALGLITAASVVGIIALILAVTHLLTAPKQGGTAQPPPPPT